MSTRIAATTTLFVLVASTSLIGQRQIYGFQGTAGTSFGVAATFLGDVNKDGVADIGIGAHLTNSSRGEALVRSGRDGRILFRLPGAATGNRFGVRMAGIGDINKDGHADFLVGANGSGGKNRGGYAQAISGKTGKALYTVDGDAAFDNLGLGLDQVGDVDKDGTLDFLVGASGSSTTAGYARVFSGKTGKVIHTVKSTNTTDNFGYSVAGVGDLNRDGHFDFAVGAPSFDGKVRNYVNVYSGKDGKLMRSIQGDSNGDYFGIEIANVGDVNNDKWPDLAIGAPQDDNNGNNSGSVRVISGFWIGFGKGAAVIKTVDGSSGSWAGWSVGRAGDQNHDGFADIIIGAPPARSIEVVSGQWMTNGKTTRTLYSQTSSIGQFGQVVRGGDDLNGDKTPDMLVGAPSSTAAFALSGRDLSLTADRFEVSISQPNTVNLSLSAGSQRSGDGYWILGSYTGTTPGIPVGAVTLPINYDYYTQLTLVPNSGPLIKTRGTLDANGKATAQLKMPAVSPALAGLVLHHAYATFDKNGNILFASNAVVIRVAR